jgi:chloramphenicol 3-O phosphotransferase
MDMIILLNGTSSSGKTTIAKILQEKYPGVLLLYGVDNVVQNAFPLKCDFPPYNEKSIKVAVSQVAGQPIAKLIVSPFMYPIYKAAVSFYKTLSQLGYDIIVDEVLFDENRITPYFELLYSEKVYFVGIKPDKDVAVQREISRKDRFRGFAAGLYDEVYNPVFTYDIVLDSGQLRPEESAGRILKYISDNKDPQGFILSAKSWVSKGKGS